MELATIAAVLRERAASAPASHRFGPRKVYLRAVLDTTSAEDLAILDQLRRAGLVILARADLVGAMDPALVAASHVRLAGADFHFLVLE